MAGQFQSVLAIAAPMLRTATGRKVEIAAGVALDPCADIVQNASCKVDANSPTCWKIALYRQHSLPLAGFRCHPHTSPLKGEPSQRRGLGSRLSAQLPRLLPFQAMTLAGFACWTKRRTAAIIRGALQAAKFIATRPPKFLYNSMIFALHA